MKISQFLWFSTNSPVQKLTSLFSYCVIILPFCRDIPLVLQHEVYGTALCIYGGCSEIKVDYCSGVHWHPASHAVSSGYGIAQLST